MNTRSGITVRYLTVTAMLSAVAFVLQFLEFAVPFMPGFIKLDLSDLPALIGGFAIRQVLSVRLVILFSVRVMYYRRDFCTNITKPRKLLLNQVFLVQSEWRCFPSRLICG